MLKKELSFLFMAGCLTILASPAFAQMADPWQLGFQKAFSPSAEKLHDFHDLLLWIIVSITLFVLFLLIYVVVKFNRKANPTPSSTTHNTKLEIIWTVIPVLILVMITIPSLRVLYFLDRTEDADMTVKIVGHQWYWSYEYPDEDDMTFDSFMLEEDELEEGQPRLLTVDNALVVPAGKNIRLLMTSADVIHSWAVPSLGVKLDTVPGRLNETWVRINEPGMYYGQCSELCGVNHGFMPINVKALNEADYAEWLEGAKEEFAQTQEPLNIKVAHMSTGEVNYE